MYFSNDNFIPKLLHFSSQSAASISSLIITSGLLLSSLGCTNSSPNKLPRHASLLVGFSLGFGAQAAPDEDGAEEGACGEEGEVEGVAGFEVVLVVVPPGRGDPDIGGEGLLAGPGLFEVGCVHIFIFFFIFNYLK